MACRKLNARNCGYVRRIDCPNVSARPACARQTSCRAPDGNAPRIVGLDPQPQDLRRRRAGRRQHRIGRDHPVALRGDQRDARIDQILLGIEHVERGALADAGFLAHAVERDLGGGDLRLVASICALAACNWPQAWVTVCCTWSRAVSRSSRRWPSVSLACRMVAYSPPP